jgi:hypothetical protein
MKEVLERIEGGTNAFAKHLRQAGRVVNGAHVHEGVELLVREIRHVIKAERERQTGEAAAVLEIAGVQHLALQFEQEGIPFEGIIEQKGEIIVRAWGHLRATRATQCDDGEWLVVA